MRAGAERVRVRQVSWFGFACFALGLFACGGRTLDDGVYGFTGSSSGATSCSYQGKAYADGSLIPGACVCFCNRGQIECEQGCSVGTGGASSGGSSGAIGGDGNATSGGSSAAGTATGGTLSTGGTATGGTAGISTGGSVGTGGSTSTGGSMSTGGVAGTGGVTMSCGSPPHASGINPMIDDMEDGNAYILPYDGRSGVWFTYNDGSQSGYQFPSVGNFVMQGSSNDATGGKFAANTYGKGFLSWGAGMGFVLNSGCPYDARVHNGLHFWVRAEFGTGSIYVLLPTAATVPLSNGGTCTEFTAMSCYDDYQTMLAVSSTWQEEFVPFNGLFQQGWGTPVMFDPGTLMGVNFQTLYGGGNSFSFSIDSISFY